MLIALFPSERSVGRCHYVQSQGDIGARSLRGRLELRQRTLRALVDTGLDAAVRSARQRMWRHGSHRVRLRHGLLARAGPGEPLPPLRRISAPRSLAVQLQLMALFEAQCPGARAGEPSRRPLVDPRTMGEPSWVELVCSLASNSSGLVRGATAKQNRVRQLKHALARLADHGMIEAGVGYHRFAGFRLLDETSAEVPYSVPEINRSVTVPAEFFLNGWVHALTDNEISLYLALRLLARSPGPVEPGSNLFLAQRMRTETFGFDRATYEAHRMLMRCGLVTVTMDPLRNPGDGTLSGSRKGTTSQYHRFTLNDDTLRQQGASTVIDALTRQLAGQTLWDVLPA